jgi:[ribosomal protein S5]-alanine N-acetyltransferase
MNIEFKQLNEINPSEIIELMNHPLVRKHMPLAKGAFDEAACREFLLAKQKLWTEYGYGPWAFVQNGKFIGWGGLQPEHGDADLALVLHPKHWGLGKAIYLQIIERAFDTFGFSSVTILFPPTRNRIRGLLRLGFKPDGELIIEGERFIRYRLSRHLAGD